MQRPQRTAVSELNALLTCKLCTGYFVDASTIVECLHTFCRSCIVQYLQTNKYCPICDVQVHKTKPLLNVKPDKVIQDIVYKLVPKLYQNEVQRRKLFYASHPEGQPSALEVATENHYQFIVSPDEFVCLSLTYFGCSGTPRYLRCPAAVTVGHLHKLIKSKYDLSNHRVEILYNQDVLNPALTLVDIACIYLWRKKNPLALSYRIYECTKKPRLDTVPQQNNNNWKEVELRISENGEMSIQQNLLDLVDHVEQYKSEPGESKPKPTLTTGKKDLPELKLITSKPTTTKDIVKINSVLTKLPSEASLPSILTASTTTVFSTINSSKCSVKQEDKVSEDKEKENVVRVKRKLEPAGQEPVKQTILNHMIGIHGLSNNHPLRKHSISREGEKCNNNNNNGNVKAKGKINVTSVKILSHTKVEDAEPPQEVKNEEKLEPKPAPSSSLVKSPTKPKPNSPIGYKTLRDPPKSWNSQISKANIKPDKPIDIKNARPAKFFKMRNNVPRYLGNPASGVKPMYQVQNSIDKDKDKIKSEGIRKHSIVKIDPKTLKPISEKAPEVSSLSSLSNDLKINTSSVSIFNPLKSHSSPKAERKSPNSPSSKRDKVNLNFTPPNPFVPNLSPTVNPNQFIYPNANFPPYDPRVMAAYHSLWYGPNMGFPSPGLGLNCLNKGFQKPLVGKVKKSKEKGEKSIENAVEKLTLNRVKEIEKSKKEVGEEKKVEEEVKEKEKEKVVEKEKECPEKKEGEQEKKEDVEVKKDEGDKKAEKEDKEKEKEEKAGEVEVREEKKEEGKGVEEEKGDKVV